MWLFFIKYISSLSLYSLSKQLAEYADWENTGEASTGGGARGITALGTPHRAAAAGFTLGAPAVDRGGETLNHGVAHEEPLFCTGFVLLVLTVFTVGFSGGISGVAQALWMCLFGDSSSAACQAAKAFDLHSVFASSGCYFSVCQTAHLYGFSLREREKGDREGTRQKCFYYSSVYFYLEMATQIVKIQLQKQWVPPE